jgi:protein-disulfide isomerase
MIKHMGCLAVLVLAGCAATGGGEPKGTGPEPGNSLGIDRAVAVRPVVPAVPLIGIAGDPTLGSASAPVTIVEFMDYQCPFCQNFARETFPQLEARYIATGKVRYVARDFPLPRHERARPAAVAAACAGEQGRFWEMHDALLGSMGKLRDDDFVMAAAQVGLDRARFDACRAEPRHAARLDADSVAARAAGVRGTPSFLVGASRGDVAQGQLLTGDEDFAAFEKVLAKYLAAEQ